MFAVMFGDVGIAHLERHSTYIGHGFILFLIGLFLCLYERKLANVKNDVSPCLAPLTADIRDVLFGSVHSVDDGRLFNLHGFNIQRYLLQTALLIQIGLGMAGKLRSRTNGDCETSRRLPIWNRLHVARSGQSTPFQ